MTLVERFQADPMPLVPEHLRDGLRRYIVHGIAPGGFLVAVLENNLFGALNRADDQSRAGLFDLTQYLYTRAPSGCFGRPDWVREWVKAGGLIGLGPPAHDLEPEHMQGVVFEDPDHA